MNRFVVQLFGSSSNQSARTSKPRGFKPSFEHAEERRLMSSFSSLLSSTQVAAFSAPAAQTSHQYAVFSIPTTPAVAAPAAPQTQMDLSTVYQRGTNFQQPVRLTTPNPNRPKDTSAGDATLGSLDCELVALNPVQ